LGLRRFDPARVERYLIDTERDMEEFRARIEEVTTNDELIDGDEESPLTNPIHNLYEPDALRFTSLCGFSPPDFRQLYEPLAERVERHRGRRTRSIGPADGFLLFLHWLRMGNSINTIATAFGLSVSAFHMPMLEVLDRVHDPLVEGFVTDRARAPSPSATSTRNAVSSWTRQSRTAGARRGSSMTSRCTTRESTGTTA
jgi:hypothetical protein